MLKWYQITDDGKALTIEIISHPEKRHYNYEDLRINPLSEVDFHNKNVTIRGVSAVWIYSHMALQAFYGGADSIKIYNREMNEYIEIIPENFENPENTNNKVLESIRFRNISDDKVLLSMEKRRWTEDDLRSLIKGFEFLPDNSSVIIHFEAANPAFIGAYIAILLALKKSQSIEYFDVRLNQLVNLETLESDQFELPTDSEKKKITVGIVGDPNSGKSVFSNVFQHYLSEKRISCWMLDADAASPTQKWYLNSPQRDSIEEDRKAQKYEWTHEMEKERAVAIRNFREYHDILLVDLPGGIHSKEKPPQRMPEGRAVMFQDLDYIILIGRDDKGVAENGWLDELKKNDIDAKVILIMTSYEDKNSFAIPKVVWRVNHFRADIRGLERDNINKIKESPDLDKLSELVQVLLENPEK